MRFEVSGMGGAGTRGDTSLPAIFEEARLVEKLGFDGLWGSDHLWDLVDRRKDQLERFTVMAALAGRTSRLRLGTLVVGNTYRHPAVLAKLVTSVDVISGGRVELGIGTGWTVPEHEAYGVPLPGFRERVERLDEALAVIRLLWTERDANFAGCYYSLKDAPFEPKNVQKPHVPITVGGVSDALIRIAVKHGDEWSAGMASPGFAREKIARLEQFCEDAGRDPASVRRSVLLSLKFIDDPAEADRYRRDYVALQISLGERKLTQKVNWIGADETLEEGLLGMMLCGSAEEICAGIERFRALGFSRIFLTVGGGEDLRRFSREVMPRFR